VCDFFFLIAEVEKTKLEHLLNDKVWGKILNNRSRTFS